MSIYEEHGTVWEHLDALRSALLQSLFVVLVASTMTFVFRETLFNGLEMPLKGDAYGILREEVTYERVTNTSTSAYRYQAKAHESLSDGGKQASIPPGESLIIKKHKPVKKLNLFNPLEGFVLSIKISLWVGAVLSSPIWIIFLARFFYPALHPFERTLVIPFLGLSFVFMGAGAMIGYAFSLPIANQYLYAFNEEIGTNLWSLSLYVSYSVALILAHAAAFEFFLVLLFTVHFQIISHESLSAYRKQMTLAAFIVAAVLTPPDVITQVILATLLIAMYESAIAYAKWRKKDLPAPSCVGCLCK